MEILSFIFTVKDSRAIGSLLVYHAQKFSFFACLFHGVFIFLVLGIPAITWKILLGYIAVTVIATEVAFVYILARTKVGIFLKEIAANMGIGSALAHIFLPFGLLVVGFFAHQYLFIGKVSNGIFSHLTNVVLMAVISGVLYPFALANIQIGIIRLCLIGKEGSL
jgi:hypothetical protein